ncbi:complement C5-like isoform X3 [Acipenser ruthenus]|uniref:complement C5-like isoform X3 n=1 Tax=Acipenser ruthenus TaxID=7906 RepID=UPI0027409B8B|nr:complement C5-like isoform X3 [Acipenser ruthenus]
MKLLGILSLLLYWRGTNAQEKTYLITAPRILRVDASERVVVQLFGYKSESKLTLSIKSYPDKKKTFATDTVTLNAANRYQNSATLKLLPQDFPKDDALRSFVYLEALSSDLNKVEMLTVSHQNGFLFIQTDKPFYTPEQSVKIRIFSLNEELRPAHRPITVTFMDPDAVKVDIVEEKDVTGIISLPDFKIPLKPKYGVWKIDATYTSDFTTSATAEFEVKEYALPSFSVTIQPQSSFICYEQFENFKFTVQSSYFHEAPMSVFIRYGIIKGKTTNMIPQAVQHVLMEQGKVEVVFNTKTALATLPALKISSLEDLDGSFLYIAVAVLESTDGISEEGELDSVKFVISPYSINMVATPLFMKPGLPYYLRAQVKDHQGNYMGKVPVRLRASAFSEGHEETQIISDGSTEGLRFTSVQDGTALFVINIPSTATKIEFTLETEDSSLPEENRAVRTYEAVAYKSLSSSYLYLDWASQRKQLHVGEYVSINIYFPSPYKNKVKFYSYQVISKGKIVKFDSISRIGESNSQNLNFRVTGDMVPSARLLVYYIITGEGMADLVADSIWLDVVEKCVNNQQVKLSSTESEYQPGNRMSLKVQAEQNSYVALSAADSALHGIRSKSKDSMAKVMRVLEQSDQGCGGGGGANNEDVFRLAGLTFMTNATAKARDPKGEFCTDINRPKRSVNRNKKTKTGDTNANNTRTERSLYLKTEIQRKELAAMFGLDSAQVRSYFPETWLWEVHQISSSSGTKTLSTVLPNSLTTWEMKAVAVSNNGICQADPLKVRVFKQTSINVPMPYSVVRGEQVVLQVSVYNYRDESSKYCVTLTVEEGICLFQGSKTEAGTTQITPCEYSVIQGLSVRAFTHTILPLETGLHRLRFTLRSQLGSEILVKTLKVVPEGIKTEISDAETLDPQGIYGPLKRRVEFRNRSPRGQVPRSKVERTLSVNGELLGEVISTVLKPSGLQQLTSLPRGSGEAELMSIAPIYYVFHFLEKSEKWEMLGPDSFTNRLELRRKLKQGIASILSFQNKGDYSYSMWQEGEPSTWLTAFVVKILGQVSQYLQVDHMSVCNTIFWLTGKCQNQDGSFRELSMYKPVKIKGAGPNSDEQTIYLTAFTAIGIQRAMKACPLQEFRDAVYKATDYLHSNVKKVKTVYTRAITAYALVLREKGDRTAYSVFEQLKKDAQVKGEPPVLRMWKEKDDSLDSFLPNKATARMVETTSYALLTSLQYGSVSYCNPIVSWLSDEQKYGGGFYSTQDTVIALEALTEYTLLAKCSSLDMVINAAYRKQGDLQRFELTQAKPLAKPVEVTKADDVIVSTGSSQGVSVVNLRTVYYKTSDPDDSCVFDLKIQVLQDDRALRSGPTRRIEACAKYVPGENEALSESDLSVMEIYLLTGMEPVQEDLATLASGVDQLIADYAIEDGRVVIQLEYIPADQYLCVGFRVQELFKTGMASPALFKVFEFHAPDRQCSKLYTIEEEKLVKLCQGKECQCMEVQCGHTQPHLSLTSTANNRREVACKADIEYAYKVKILSSSEEGHFISYKAEMEDIFKKGLDRVRKETVVTFIKKATCSDVNLQEGKYYLIMGKEGMLSVENMRFKYTYPLDPLSWIEFWPSEEDCDSQACSNFLKIMQTFSEDFLIFGCTDI